MMTTRRLLEMADDIENRGLIDASPEGMKTLASALRMAAERLSNPTGSHDPVYPEEFSSLLQRGILFNCGVPTRVAKAMTEIKLRELYGDVSLTGDRSPASGAVGRRRRCNLEARLYERGEDGELYTAKVFSEDEMDVLSLGEAISRFKGRESYMDLSHNHYLGFKSLRQFAEYVRSLGFEMDWPPYCWNK